MKKKGKSGSFLGAACSLRETPKSLSKVPTRELLIKTPPPKTPVFSNLTPLKGGVTSKPPPSDKKKVKKSGNFFRLRRADVLVPSLL